MSPTETATDRPSRAPNHPVQRVKNVHHLADNPTGGSSTESASASPSPPSPSPSQSGNRNTQILNMKSESDRRRTYEKWPVSFMDANHLSAAGFYFTNRSDVVCCAFCGVEVGRWEEGDDAFRDHQRWSPSCGFIKGLGVGNIPIGSDGQPGTSSSLLLPFSPQETNRSYDVCGPHMELRPNSGPEQGRLHYLCIMVSLSMCESGII